MAERRMFAKTIVLSDAFLDMPMSARCLYFTLGMFADDDGFVNSPRGIMRQCGASDDDLKVLLAKKFLLAFESGVIVIKHWRINNYLQKDRYTPTKYLEEKATLTLDENSAYKEAKALSEDMYTQSVYTQVRLGKDSVGKDRLGEDNNTLTLTGSSVCAQGSAVLESYFDTFWREYPKKKSKGTALKAFNKALKRTDFDTIMEALRMLKGSNEWTNDGGQYVPYPATWLNADGWNDEVNASVDKYDNLRKLYELTKED